MFTVRAGGSEFFGTARFKFKFHFLTILFALPRFESIL